MFSTGSLRTKNISIRFGTSLRCLSHPLTLGSLAVLLLNDHWLKQAAPSALTGKLSDFAGLFFFPFLLSAMLGLVLNRWRVAERRIAALSFAVTLVWFTAMKTLPAANLATARLSGLITGGIGQIVLDPSDLVALLSLLPAWLLYLHVERQPAPHPPGRLAYLTLGAAVLASLATSPRQGTYYDRFVPVEGGLLLAYGPAIVENMPKELDPNDFAFSADGLMWQSYSDVTAQQYQAAQAVPVLPLQVCRTPQPLECYRITGQPEVERSTDGGATWQVDWQFPVERVTYMESQSLIGPEILNINPLDLAILELPDGPRVVAAVGDQGALLRWPSGEWQRLEVLHAVPIATKASGLRDALNHLIIETFTLVGLVVVGILVLLTIGWLVVLLGTAEKSKRGWALRPLWLLVAAAVVAVLARQVIIAYGGGLEHVVVAFLLVAGLTLAGLIWTGKRISKLASRPKAMGGLVRIAIFGSLAAALAALVVLILWAYAVIPVYETALLLAGVVGGIILLVSLVAAVLLSLRAIKAQTNVKLSERNGD